VVRRLGAFSSTAGQALSGVRPGGGSSGGRFVFFATEIIRHGWYPRGADPNAWLARYGAVEPVFNGNPLEVLQVPFILMLITTAFAAVYGIVQDLRYKNRLVSGIQFEGAQVATVDEYNAETKGDGMGYVVQPWKDR
jgi:hypothetical protein